MANDLDEEHKLFKTIVEAVCESHRSPEPAESPELLRIREFTGTHFPPLEPHALRTLLAGGGKRIDTLEVDYGKFVYLKPVLKNNCMVPIMAFKYDMRGPGAIASIRIALFIEHESGHEKEVKAIGYRFESGSGMHGYCHVQHIKEFDKNFRLQTENWIPDEAPAIPIEAGGPVGLLLCTLGSLYGKTDIASSMNAAGIRLDKVKRSVERMKPQFFDWLS